MVNLSTMLIYKDTFLQLSSDESKKGQYAFVTKNPP